MVHKAPFASSHGLCVHGQRNDLVICPLVDELALKRAVLSKLSLHTVVEDVAQK